VVDSGRAGNHRDVKYEGLSLGRRTSVKSDGAGKSFIKSPVRASSSLASERIGGICRSP